MSKISGVAAGTLTVLTAFAALAVARFGDAVGPVYLTGASVVLGIFVLTMGWLVSAYSARNLRGQRRQGRYAALMALAIVSLFVAVTADPILLTAAGWTLSGLAVAGLVAHADTGSARSAARRVAARLMVGDLALWAAVALMLSKGVGARSDLQDVGISVPALLALAGIVRSALIPAWRWLPLTAEAPSPVSALLHAGVVNGMGLLAVLFWPVFAAEPAVLLALVVVGTLTAVLATAAMKVRPDVKGRLASSTSAQMGYMTLQVGLGLPAVALLHLIGHGFYKSWLFLRAGGATRRIPATAPRMADWWVIAGLGSLSSVVIALAAATWDSRPVVDLVPLTVAGAAATLALAALVRPDRRTQAHSTARGRSWSALIIMSGLFTYVLVLGVWVPLFGMEGPWSGAVAAELTAAVLVLGGLGMTAAATGILRNRVIGVVVDTADRLSGTVVAPVAADGHAVDGAVWAASRTVGPMWPIHSAVAVNPLAGIQDLHFADAAEVARRTWGARSHLTEAQYAQALGAGRFTRADLVAAAGGFPRPAEQIADYLVDRVDWQPSGAATFAAEHVLAGVDDAALAALGQPGPAPRTLGEQTGNARSVSGLANAWTALSNRDLPVAGGLWAAFQAQVRDFGLRGLRSAVRGLPQDPVLAIGVLLADAVPPHAQVGYLARLLARDPGWAAHLKQRDPGLIADLLAVRASIDVLAATATGGAWQETAAVAARDWALRQVAPVVDLLHVDDADEALSLAGQLDEAGRCAIWQRAWEQRYRNRLVDRISARAAEDQPEGDADAQVVMCIDVRSERLRRHLESTGDYRTYGFAGFFGVAIRHQTLSGASSDQCPVLLEPASVITEDDTVTTSEGTTTALRSGLVRSAAAPAAPLAIAEGLGVLAGVDAIAQTAAPGLWSRMRDTVAPPRRGELGIGRKTIAGEPADVEFGMTVEQRTNAAAGMLRALGIVEEFAPVLLIVGHAATVENNAFAAAYDCGACGGHGGYVNARVMAAVLNDPRVRRRLAAEHGIVVPDATAAVPAWHNTTTDAVTVDGRDVPTTHRSQLAALRADLLAAQQTCLAERFAELPGARSDTPAAAVRRAGDWAEPQPEWGLAGNAAFVIGPRSMTRGVNLRGRVFLHSYEPGLDVDGSTLELLLTAPMVVAQWINNQYYFSTVDPQRFGAGDKTTHNVVGDYGVFSGAGGDLRVGLPWQGVHREQPGDDDTLMHEPLRLQVLVYAAPDDIVRVLDQHPQVAALVANEWIALAAIDPGSGEALALGSDLRWRPWLAPPVGDTVGARV